MTPKRPNLTELVADPKLSRPPRIRLVKVGADTSEADLGIELANAYVGVVLYDWQEDLLRSWLAVDPDGKYAHQICGLLLGRQNGKTKGVIVARILVGLIFYGEVIRYSAHLSDTMNDVVNILFDIFGDKEQERRGQILFPELHKLVRKTSNTNGNKYIALNNGGYIDFECRSNGKGRGKTLDVNIVDEAQYMTQSELADVAPAMSAGKRQNPQTIYVGTPPDYEKSLGEVFGNVRDSALEGADGICWHEWSVSKEQADAAYDDEEMWYATNPSLGYSLSFEYVKNTEHRLMSKEKFLRERLSYWSKAEILTAVNMEDWEATKADEPPKSFTKYCLGIKFSPNGTHTSVSAAMLLPDGSTYCELVENRDADSTSGKQWLIDFVLKRKDNISLVAIDGKSGAQEIHDRLRKAGMRVAHLKVMNTNEVIVASTMLNSSLEEKTIAHLPGKELDASALGSTKRKIGTDGYGFGGDSIPLESLAIANWAAKTTKRKPGRGINNDNND